MMILKVDSAYVTRESVTTRCTKPSDHDVFSCIERKELPRNVQDTMTSCISQKETSDKLEGFWAWIDDA